MWAAKFEIVVQRSTKCMIEALSIVAHEPDETEEKKTRRTRKTRTRMRCVAGLPLSPAEGCPSR